MANLFDLAYQDLAMARDHPAIHDEGLVEHSGELVANFATVAGEIVIHANEKDGACGNGQSAGNGLGGLRWGVGRVLHWPIVRIGRLVHVL